MTDEEFEDLGKRYMRDLGRLQLGYIKTTADWKSFHRIKAEYKAELDRRVELAVNRPAPVSA